MRKAANLTTFMCRLSRNIGASTSWKPQGLSGTVRDCITFILLQNTHPGSCCTFACERGALWVCPGIRVGSAPVWYCRSRGPPWRRRIQGTNPESTSCISEPAYGTPCMCTWSFSARQTSSSPTRAGEGGLKHQIGCLTTLETILLLSSTGLNWSSVKTHQRRLDDDIKADLKIRRSFCGTASAVSG